MPEITVVFFAEENRLSPLLEWLDKLPAKVQDKCLVKIERLNEMGYELRRPEADILRDGIYELRVGFMNVNYRILYFFCGQEAVISHGCIKEKEVSDKDINLAKKRKALYEQDSERYRYKE